MRITENFIGSDDKGNLIGAKLTVADPTNAKKKDRKLLIIGTGVEVTAAVPYKVESVETLTTFLNTFNGLGVKERSGYDQYYNDFGPTNPESPRGLSTQGLVKVIAVMKNVLHERVAAGGADGAEAKSALDILTAHDTVALANILAAEKKSLLAKYKTMFSAEELAEEARQMSAAATVPLATVDASEATEMTEEEERATRMHAFS